VKSRAGPWIYTAVTVALWGGALPAILIRDEVGSLAVPWRAPGWIVLGGALLLAGTALVLYPAERLARAGVALFGVAPGRVLVTDSWYGRVRNPIDIGTTAIAFAAWVALDVELMWVMPVAALLTFTVGTGLYEDRRLLEEFADDFERYKREVPKWFPRLSRSA
jgi:protein-S-isoprenylcysteine O-methyltransferase Ste14